MDGDTVTCPICKQQVFAHIIEFHKSIYHAPAQKQINRPVQKSKVSSTAPPQSQEISPKRQILKQNNSTASSSDQASSAKSTFQRMKTTAKVVVRPVVVKPIVTKSAKLNTEYVKCKFCKALLHVTQLQHHIDNLHASPSASVNDDTDAIKSIIKDYLHLLTLKAPFNISIHQIKYLLPHYLINNNKLSKSSIETIIALLNHELLVLKNAEAARKSKPPASIVGVNRHAVSSIEQVQYVQKTLDGDMREFD